MALFLKRRFVITKKDSVLIPVPVPSLVITLYPPGFNEKKEMKDEDLALRAKKLRSFQNVYPMTISCHRREAVAKAAVGVLAKAEPKWRNSFRCQDIVRYMNAIANHFIR